MHQAHNGLAPEAMDDVLKVRPQGAMCNTGTGRGFKTIITPSSDAIKRHDEALSECIRRNQAATQENLIGRLNPKIAGWSNYYRAVISKEVFQKLDHQLYVKLARWARVHLAT